MGRNHLGSLLKCQFPNSTNKDSDSMGLDTTEEFNILTSTPDDFTAVTSGVVAIGETFLLKDGNGENAIAA